MLTRRHIRVKVMQSLYAMARNGEENMAAEKRFLEKSMSDMHDLFLLNLSLLVEVKNLAEDFMERSKAKILATQEDKNPNLKFVNNLVIQKIEESEEFNELLEKRKLNNWFTQPGFVQLLWDALQESELYQEYMQTRENDFKEDKAFIIDFFSEIIAPEPKIHDYFEDTRLTWMDDLPIVNTALVKRLKKTKKDGAFKIPSLFKNDEDRDFAFDLFRRTLMYQADFDTDITEKTPNWDKERLAEIDSILLKMALCEFMYFPTIPVKVTINEYLEISKEYSTPKSSIFINGVLDQISKDYEEKGQINKIGRGLM